jgi:hypothetical protein
MIMNDASRIQRDFACKPARRERYEGQKYRKCSKAVFDLTAIKRNKPARFISYPAKI